MEFPIIKQLFTEDKYKILNEIIHNSQFMERVLTSSTSLYNSLVSIIENNKRIDAKTEKTLIKYLIRMASRPQPYGLNAGIVLEYEENLIEDDYIKEVLISLEWRTKIGHLAENELLISSDINLLANPLLYIKGNQYCLERNKNNKNEYIYITATPFLTDFLEFLKTPKKLKDIFTRYNKNKSSEQILDIIKQLLNKSVIKSDISSSSINLNNDQFFEYIENMIPTDCTFNNELKKIKKLFNEYRYSKIGNGINTYIHLIDSMSSLCLSKRYLSINLYYVEKEKKEVDHPKITEQDFKIMTFFDTPLLYNWKTYQNMFLGKYGQNVQVSLLKLLDSDLGLGVPPKTKQGNFSKNIESFIINRILQTISSKNNILYLNSEDYAFLENNYKKNQNFDKLPSSFDCKIIPFQNKVIIPPNAFSFPRHSFTGRFSLSKPKSSIKEKGHAELNYISSNFPDIGITYKSESEYFIDCVGDTKNSTQRVPLNEVYVTAFDNKFHLVYNNKIIYPVLTHLLEYRNFNEHPAIIFLQDYSRYVFEHPNTFPVDKFNFLDFIPRIEYKNFVISPARINIVVNKNLTTEEKSQIVLEHISKYKFDSLEYIYLLDGDKCLPVPTNNDLSIKMLGNSFTNIGEKGILTLMEAPELTSETNEIYDYIFSSQSKKIIDNKVSKNFELDILGDLPTFESIIDHKWSSYKLYYAKGKRHKIEKIISIFFDDKPDIDFFFVNYKNTHNAEHIRLRFKKNSEVDTKLENLLFNLINNGDLYNLEVSLFRPEVERYGGKAIYSLVYKLFSINSRAIQVIRNNYHMYDRLEAAIYLSSFTFYELLHGELRLLKEYMNEIYPKNSKFVKDFSRNRSHYCSIVLKAIKDYEENQDPLLFEKKILAQKIIDMMYAKKNSRYQISYLIKSIVHMEINRHFPFDSLLEDKAAQYMRFSFSNIIYRLIEDRS